MPDEADFESVLLDVTAVDPAELAVLPGSVLSEALGRLMAEIREQPDHYAAFQNSM